MQNNLESLHSASFDRVKTSRGSLIKGFIVGLVANALSFIVILNAPTIYFALYVTRNWSQTNGINGQEFATIFLSREFAIWRIAFAMLASLIASVIGGYAFSQFARAPKILYIVIFSSISAVLIWFIHGWRDYTLSYDYARYDSNALLMQMTVAILGIIGGLLGIALVTRKSRL